MYMDLIPSLRGGLGTLVRHIRKSLPARGLHAFRSLKKSPNGFGRATAQTEALRKKRSEAETDHETLNGPVAFHKPCTVVESLGEVRRVDMGGLVKKDFADQSW